MKSSKSMKLISTFFSIFLMGIVSSSCSDSSEEPVSPNELKIYNLQGKVEKGPFVSGSDITIQPVNSKMQVIGEMYNTSITDDMGSFTLKSKEFASPYAELMAKGYFFNETTGALSDGTLTLRALVDLNDSTTVHVNVLTHLMYARVKHLIGSGLSFMEANVQAQTELLEAFGLGAFRHRNVAAFSITAGTEESAALIAISSLLLNNRTEAELTEYLTKLSNDFSRNGYFSQPIKQQISQDKVDIVRQLDKIKEYIIQRYANLGFAVEVKNLFHYIDWNEDGVAGNETLKENEIVTLATDSIVIPNEGGHFMVAFNSPIPLYLEPQLADSIDGVSPPMSDVEEDVFYDGLYENGNDDSSSHQDMNCEISLEEKNVVIKVSALNSYHSKTKVITLYDYVGNAVGTLTLTQVGKEFSGETINIPLLGKKGQQMVLGAIVQMASALSNYNIVEQIYHYNPEVNMVHQYITPRSSYISDAWEKLYKASGSWTNLRAADEARLNVYGNYFNVFSAMIYSNLVYGWDAVPYICDKKTQDFIAENGGIERTSAQHILEDLSNRLLVAIDELEEKKNDSFKSANSIFFVSKDVARILLANIYMYENKYSEAYPLLKKVVDNGFYTLDAAVCDDVNSIQKSPEVIFAFLNENSTRTHVTIKTPSCLPYLTLGDVYLSLAECMHFMNEPVEAEHYLNQVIQVKQLTTQHTDLLMRIKEVRAQTLLHSCTYFAFLKRTGLAEEVCGIKEYQLLFPIPQSEMNSNSLMTQNPNYN